jgi:hypothetical protein
MSQNFVSSQCTVILFGTSLSEYAFLHGTQIAATDFGTKWCSKMNIRSVRECGIFARAQLLLNWREQRPSNEGVTSSQASWWRSVECIIRVRPLSYFIVVKY